jgi:hypothetical protein
MACLYCQAKFSTTYKNISLTGNHFLNCRPNENMWIVNARARIYLYNLNCTQRNPTKQQAHLQISHDEFVDKETVMRI